MLIDHTGIILITDPTLYLVFRSIGRLAFPIFAFFIAEGCDKTRDIKGYLLRLLLFGFISEIPFDLAGKGKLFELGHQNIFFTLFLGALSIYLYHIVTEEKGKSNILGLTLAVGIAWVATILHTDYGALGVMLIFILYYNRRNFRKQALTIVVINLLFLNPLQLWACFSIIPLYFYNKTRGRNLKYIFYAFYPLHLLILELVRSITKGAI